MNDPPPPGAPRIALTMGDPAGVGPELCLKALGSWTPAEGYVPVAFADAAVLRRVAQRLQLPLPWRVVRRSEWPEFRGRLAEPAVLDVGGSLGERLQPGRVDRDSGRAAYQCIERAIDCALAGDVDAVTTGPIHKQALHAAGIRFPGHTEIFAARTGTERYCMMLTAPEITCSFVTAHVGYRDVPELITRQRVLEVIQLSAEALGRLRDRPPTLVVCGLNPHAGEQGLFGDREEQRYIAPAVEAARALGIDVHGPLPPDTAFLPARRRETDCFVCMYHDQGHIPLKALAFDVAVNVTLGLPIVRTSVDHGTALDIAWQGVASPTSLVQALRLASRLAAARAPGR